MRLLREFRPQLLILGTSLPGDGCYRVLSVMHQQPELRPQFVLILASPQDQLALYHVAACHIDDYQFKPLSPDRLEQYLEGRRQDGLELAGLGRPERPPLPDVPQVRQKYFPASGQFLSPSGPNTADSSRR